MQVRGDWLPRTIFGRFYILCAILRQFVLVASLILWERHSYDIFFVDQLSACVPLLKWFTTAKVNMLAAHELHVSHTDIDVDPFLLPFSGQTINATQFYHQKAVQSTCG